MAQFNVQQVAAPNFSGIGDLLRGANQSFNNAFDSANTILGQYQEGQAAKADANFLDSIANVANEQQLTDFFVKNPRFADGLSPEMQKTALAMRNTVLGYDTTRINNNNAVDSNSRANAQEGRQASEYSYGVKARDALNSMTPAITAAYAAGQTYGQPAADGRNGPAPGSVGPTLFNAAEKQYGLPAGYLSITAQLESGGDPNARNPKSSAGGLFQQTDANAKDYGVTNKFDPVQSTDGAARFGADNASILRSRLGREPTGAELYLAHQQGAGGASALLANPNAKASDIVGTDAVRLNGGSPDMTAGEFANLWISKYNRVSGDPNVGGATPGPTGYSGGQYNGYMATPQMQAALAAISANPYLGPDAAKALVDNLISGTKAGQDAITARNDAVQTQAAAAAQIAGITNPTNITPGAVGAQVLATPGLDPAVALKAAQDGVATASGPLAPVLAPATIADPSIQAAVDAGNANDQRNAALTSIGRNQSVVESMTADPAKTLMETAGISKDSGISENYINAQLSRYATQAGITIPEAAATLEQADASGIALKDVLTGRVDDKLIIDTMKRTYGTDTQAVGNAQKVATANLAGERQKIQTRISTLQTQMAKPGMSAAERALHQAEIEQLKSDLNKTLTPTANQKAIVDQMKPSDPGYAAALQNFANAIDADASLTASEKAQIKASYGIK